MATEWVTLEHEGTGALHRFPANTAEAWGARGWKPFDPSPPAKTKPVKTPAATPAPDKE